MSSNPYVNLAIGIVAGVVTGGLGYAYFGLSSTAAWQLGFTAYALTQVGAGLAGSRKGNGKSASAAALEVVTSTEATVVPVVFGTARVAGNIVNYKNGSFQTFKVTTASGGKGGGRREVAGYEYYLVWDVALCMGPVDAIGKVSVTPGEEVGCTGTTFTGDYQDMIFVGTDTGGAAAGDIRVYRGTATQTRQNDEEHRLQGDSNYRQICFAAMGLSPVLPTKIDPKNFRLGASSAPATYLFEITRIPKVQDDNNVDIAGFPARVADPVATTAITSTPTLITVTTASAHNFLPGEKIRITGVTPAAYNKEWTILATPSTTQFTIGTNANPGTATVQGSVTGDAYLDANPLAVMWEIHQNKVWGRGQSTSLLHLPSWLTAANWCKTNRIGVSLVLTEQDSVAQLFDKLRSHLGLELIWDGAQWRAMIMADRASAYASRVVLTKEHYIGEPVFSRGSWEDTANEIRVEFTDRNANWGRGIVVEQDLANLTMTGTIRSTKLDLELFANRRAAQLTAARLRQEHAVPRATLELKLMRLASGILPMIDLIEWQSDEFGVDATTYWRATNVTDNPETGEITLRMIEDLWATPALTHGLALETVATPIELAQVASTSDLYAGDDTSAPIPTGDFTPLRVWEPNAYLSAGKRSFFLTTEKRSGTLSGINAYWLLDGGSLANFIARQSPFAVTGTLLTALGITGYITREITFDVALSEAADGDVLLSSANKVQTGSHTFEALAGGRYDLMLIDSEIIAIGYATNPSAGVYRCANLMRGMLGTEIAAHSIGAQFAYMPAPVLSDHLFLAESVPNNLNIDLKFFPHSSGSGQGAASVTVDINPWSNHGSKPLRPAFLWRQGWIANWRPRYHDKGAETGVVLSQDLDNLVTELPANYGMAWQPYDGSNAPIGAVQYVGKSSITYFPDDGSTRFAGIASYDLTALVPGGTTRIEIAQTLSGVAGPFKDLGASI